MQTQCLHNIPAEKGSYVLCFQLDRPLTTNAGSLGLITIQPGWLYYCGSARGNGGLSARIRHHLSSSAQPHWHFDHIRPWLQFIDGLYLVSNDVMECTFAQTLIHHPQAIVPVPGFGSSDCKQGCRSHLIATALEMEDLQHLIEKNLPKGIRYNWGMINNNEVT